MPGVRVIGFGPEGSSVERAPTVSFVGRRPPEELARALAEHGIFVWHGHMYALPLTEALGLGTEGVLRVGLLHYNTAAEVDALTERLSEMV